MGVTRFSGPVYGAKTLLWVAGPAVENTTSASTVLAFLQGYSKRVVPPYEDWIVTEAYVSCSTASTVAAAVQYKLKTEGGSSNSQRSNGQASTNAATILTVTGGGSSNINQHVIATVSAGEYEGTWCPAGSTLRWVSSCADVTTAPQFNVMGYIRYIDSTRAV